MLPNVILLGTMRRHGRFRCIGERGRWTMAEKVSPEMGATAKRICDSFADALPVDGAAVSLFGATPSETHLYASDKLAAQLDELQFDLGEGPRWEAVRTRRPVLVPDSHDGTQELWPIFGQAFRQTDARAVFVFPLMVGALDVGVIELHRVAPGALSREELAMAAVLAQKGAWALLSQVLTFNGSSGSSSGMNDSPRSRREIHQATGMILAQAGVSATDALLLLRAHAFAQGRSVRDVARDVVARTLDFT